MQPQPVVESPHARIERIRRETTALMATITTTEEEAKAAGARPLTQNYVTRLIGQAEMLLNEVKQSAGTKILLVRTKNGVAIYRPKA